MDKKIQDILVESKVSLESENDSELKNIISDLLDLRKYSVKDILCKLSKCIISYKLKKTKNKWSFLLDPVSYLASFCTEQVEVFVSPYVKKDQSCIFISRILPKLDITERQGEPACQIYIEGTNGKVYTYAILPLCSVTTCMQESRVLQFFSFLNDLLEMEPTTSKRSLKFSTPSIIPMCAKIKIVEDDVLSVSLLDLFEKYNDSALPYTICAQSPGFLDALEISDHLTSSIFVSNLGYEVTPQMLEEIFKLAGKVVKIHLEKYDDHKSEGHGIIEMGHPDEALQAISMFNGQMFCNRIMSVEMYPIMTPFLSLYYEFFTKKSSSQDEIHSYAEDLFCKIQKHIVPKTILKQEFRSRSPSEFYELRKSFSRYMSLYYLAQFCFGLNQQTPEKFYIHEDVGKITNFGLIFNLSELDSSFPQDVPFQITPNIFTAIAPVGILGYMKLAICAAARCFFRQDEKVGAMLKTVCLNETDNSLVKDTKSSFDHDAIAKFVDIVTQKIEGLADFKGFGGLTDSHIELSEECTKFSMMCPSHFPWL